jgi:hypothetical protein
MAFLPEQFSFQKIDFTPQGVVHFEKNLNFNVGSKPQWNRLNLYLSQDGSYVTIWFGFLETFVLEQAFKHVEGFSITDSTYDEVFFRGHIENNETAQIILRAIGYEKHLAQLLHIENGAVRYDILTKMLSQQNLPSVVSKK